MSWIKTINIFSLADNGCPHPGVPIAGRLYGNDFSVGSVVTFSCDPGYVMEGDSRQTCLEFKQWSGDGAPQCKGKYIADNTKKYSRDFQRRCSNCTNYV